MRIFPSYFYKTAPLQLPNDVSHRHFRLRKGDSWIKLFRVKDEKELRAYLLRFLPDAAYFSVSTFLYPEKMGLKWQMQGRGYKNLSNIILSSDFFMDFDHAEALKDARAACSFLKEHGFEDFKLIATKRGYHLWILDFYDKACKKNRPVKPEWRESFILAHKIRLANKLSAQGIRFDYKVSIDVRRIARVWGSLHDDGFTVCKDCTQTILGSEASRNVSTDPAMRYIGMEGSERKKDSCSAVAALTSQARALSPQTAIKGVIA